MKIIIPMSGIGKRFIDVGYKNPKPLIKVNGKPIIEYVVSMFPGEHEFIFICNREHLENTHMREVLESLKPDSTIIAIEPHKQGPVYAISKAFDLISDEDEVMVSYCDYYMEWDFEKFQAEIDRGDWDGAVPCYIGFHPHLLHEKYYAGVLADEEGKMLDIKEKHCFTNNLMDCHQSAGAYYFRRGSDVKRYFQELMDQGINLNGEYYVSMVYYLYLRDNLRVHVPKVNRFMQWGTPEDLEEFEAWSRIFAELHGKEKGITEVPEERESVSIPHPFDSEEYRNSYSYWKDYFLKD